jgi:hypothetical protein
VSETRSCGDCRLCCRVLGVDEIGKEPGAWCGHACSTGCAIYAARPGQCRDFVCSWLAGQFRDEDRPDRSKLVVVVCSPPRLALDGRTDRTHQLVECHAGEPGAATTKRGRAVLEQIFELGWAAAVHFDSTVTLHFPSGNVSKIPFAQVSGDRAAWKDDA